MYVVAYKKCCTSALHSILLLKQVFRTSKFNVDQNVVDKFFNAETVTIAEAIGSPAKRRVSLQGQVVKVSPSRHYMTTLHMR